MKKKIKLVLSGSGCRYPTHAGAILRLADEGYEIEEICGTSGGAILAAGIASGYDPNEETVNLLKQTLPSKTKAIDASLFSLIFKWGLIKGNKIENLLEKYFVKTFKETTIPVHIVTTSLDRRCARVFSTKTDPDMSLAKAVRASMSIPGVFAPVEIDGETYVDGGVTGNYLLDIFGTGEDVIGFRFGAAHKAQNYNDIEPKKINSVSQYINANLDAMMEAATREHIDDAMFARTITLETKHGGLDFGMTEEDVDDMISEGYHQVDEAIKKGII